MVYAPRSCLLRGLFWFVMEDRNEFENKSFRGVSAKVPVLSPLIFVTATAGEH